MAERTSTSNSSAPRLLSRGRATATIIFAYAAAALAATLFFKFMGKATGQDDGRDWHLALIFGGAMVVMCVWALLGVHRRPKVLDR